MNWEYYQQIAKSNALRKSRDKEKNFILSHLDRLPSLLEIAFNTKDTNHHKACWILELVCQEKLELLLPYLDAFCNNLPLFQNDSALRSISKICLFLTQNNGLTLTTFQQNKIIEACLDWLITENKVATKVYAMYTLANFSQNHFWLKETLHNLILKDFFHQSPAYKAATKAVLRKINK